MINELSEFEVAHEELTNDVDGVNGIAGSIEKKCTMIMSMLWLYALSLF